MFRRFYEWSKRFTLVRLAGVIASFVIGFVVIICGDIRRKLRRLMNAVGIGLFALTVAAQSATEPNLQPTRCAGWPDKAMSEYVQALEEENTRFVKLLDRYREIAEARQQLINALTFKLNELKRLQNERMRLRRRRK